MKLFLEKIENFMLKKEGHSLDKIKLDALEQFKNYYEAKNLKVKLDELDFANLKPTKIPENLNNANLIFINGHFDPETSQVDLLQNRAELTTFKKAMTTYGSFLQNHCKLSLKSEKNPKALINFALFEEGAFLYLPPNTIIDKPIQILNISICDKPSVILNPRLHIFAGKNCKIDLIFNNIDLRETPIFNNVCLDFVLEEGASIYYQKTSDHSHYETLRAQLKKNSSLKTVNIGANHSDYSVSLNGENAKAEMYGLTTLDNDKTSSAHIKAIHNAPKSFSKQLYKTVLDGRSRSNFDGKIFIDAGAYQTNADQKNHNLLLSVDAKALSSPSLEIFADDVKASHGATFGQLEKDSLFYLKSRGLGEKQAMRLLIEAFCKEIRDKLKYDK